LAEAGDVDMKYGYLQEAFKHFAKYFFENISKNRAFDYSKDSMDLINMGAYVSLVSLCMDNYGYLYRYCENVVDLPVSGESKKDLLRALYAISLFAYDRFAEAAQQLLQIKIAKSESDLRKVMTPQDYAYYTVMCSLATMSRNPLKKVDENPNLKSILENVPELSGIINSFLASQYTDVYAKLANVRNANKFNTLFLKQAELLLNNITEKAIIQYCLPYKSVDLKIMAKSLGIDMVLLEDKLVIMSSEGKIRAKIDSHNKVLYLKKEDLKAKSFKTTLENGKKFIQQAREAILRMKMIKGELVLKSKDASEKEKVEKVMETALAYGEMEP